ncbi:hypothetical protein X801_06029 [Opisthorchis viverrini]|uniref:Uncharacterized protein n=1 Tax=Opisthorchis viverrini TaxID=6198 RepID=A0A1S8WUW1_OPIVI|nr:hypothetical protein X801_06029 [Opisthorchis viverrini]
MKKEEADEVRLESPRISTPLVFNSWHNRVIIMLYIPGLIAIIIFYLLILLVGFWAARKSRSNPAGTTETEDVMLAGRNIGLIVGIFTMTGA